MRPPALSVLVFAAAAAFLASPLAWRGRPGETRLLRASPPNSAGRLSAASAGIDFSPTYFALDPSAPIDAPVERAAFNPADAYGGLPQTDGYELVAARCAACHSLNVVMQQRLPQERWDYLLTWMSESKGMPALVAEDRRTVLDYLVRNFGPQAD
ncbi:MAG: hypothetical protein ABL957_16260 [Parvularculaceae bacterium]